MYSENGWFNSLFTFPGGGHVGSISAGVTKLCLILGLLTEILLLIPVNTEIS